MHQQDGGVFKQRYTPYIDGQIFYEDESILNLHDSQIFILLKPGHYDLLYHKDFLEEASDIDLPDAQLLTLFKGVIHKNQEKSVEIARCKHSFSPSVLRVLIEEDFKPPYPQGFFLVLENDKKRPTCPQCALALECQDLLKIFDFNQFEFQQQLSKFQGREKLSQSAHLRINQEQNQNVESQSRQDSLKQEDQERSQINQDEELFIYLSCQQKFLKSDLRGKYNQSSLPSFAQEWPTCILCENHHKLSIDDLLGFIKAKRKDLKNLKQRYTQNQLEKAINQKKIREQKQNEKQQDNQQQIQQKEIAKQNYQKKIIEEELKKKQSLLQNMMKYDPRSSEKGKSQNLYSPLLVQQSKVEQKAYENQRLLIPDYQSRNQQPPNNIPIQESQSEKLTQMSKVLPLEPHISGKSSLGTCANRSDSVQRSNALNSYFGEYKNSAGKSIKEKMTKKPKKVNLNKKIHLKCGHPKKREEFFKQFNTINSKWKTHPLLLIEEEYEISQILLPKCTICEDQIQLNTLSEAIFGSNTSKDKLQFIQDVEKMRKNVKLPITCPKCEKKFRNDSNIVSNASKYFHEQCIKEVKKGRPLSFSNQCSKCHKKRQLLHQIQQNKKSLCFSCIEENIAKQFLKIADGFTHNALDFTNKVIMMLGRRVVKRLEIQKGKHKILDKVREKYPSLF